MAAAQFLASLNPVAVADSYQGNLLAEGDEFPDIPDMWAMTPVTPGPITLANPESRSRFTNSFVEEGVFAWAKGISYPLVGPAAASPLRLLSHASQTMSTFYTPYNDALGKDRPPGLAPGYSPAFTLPIWSPTTSSAWSSAPSTGSDEDLSPSGYGLMSPLLSPVPRSTPFTLFVLDDAAHSPGALLYATSPPPPDPTAVDMPVYEPSAPHPEPLYTLSPAPSDDEDSDSDADNRPSMPCVVPLRITGAPRRMRRMMGVFRLDPFIGGHHVRARGNRLCWDGVPPGPLHGPSMVGEFQVVLADALALSHET